MASDHLIVVEKLADFRWPGADSRVVTAEDFISERVEAPGASPLAPAKRPRKVINLCRNYDYLSLGYYCSPKLAATASPPTSRPFSTCSNETPSKGCSRSSTG